MFLTYHPSICIVYIHVVILDKYEHEIPIYSDSIVY